MAIHPLEDMQERKSKTVHFGAMQMASAVLAVLLVTLSADAEVMVLQSSGDLDRLFGKDKKDGCYKVIINNWLRAVGA